MHQSGAALISVRMVLPSEIRLLDLVHSASEKMAVIAGFDEDDALNIGLAMREAVINAMVHGNGSDPGLEVTLVLAAGDGHWSARITDQGEGFDPDATDDPTEEENLLKTSGRGLLLMRAFVDEVRYRSREEGGTEVTLTKTCKPGTDENPDSNT